MPQASDVGAGPRHLMRHGLEESGENSSHNLRINHVTLAFDDLALSVFERLAATSSAACSK